MSSPVVAIAWLGPGVVGAQERGHLRALTNVSLPVLPGDDPTTTQLRERALPQFSVDRESTTRRRPVRSNPRYSPRSCDCTTVTLAVQPQELRGEQLNECQLRALIRWLPPCGA